jgi:hypothetical protein
MFLIICQFLKILKNKVSQKITEFFLKFLRLKWGREAPGTPQGDPPCHHTTWWRGPGQAALWHGVGPPGPRLILPPAIPLSPMRKHHSIAQTRVLSVLARNFRSPCSAHLRC